MRNKCQSTDLVPLRSKKTVQTTPTRQNSNTFLGFFPKFSSDHPVTQSYMGAPPPPWESYTVYLCAIRSAVKNFLCEELQNELQVGSNSILSNVIYQRPTVAAS